MIKGTYLLLIKLPQDTTLAVGKQGMYHFQKGYYAYIGSALNGLDQRIRRHLRTSKKIHWHIDYLLSFGTVRKVFIKESTLREECLLSHALHQRLCSVEGFGCSDCSCPSHLFYGSYHDILHAAHDVHMKPYAIHTNP